MAMKAVAFQRTAPQRRTRHSIEWLREYGTNVSAPAAEHRGGFEKEWPWPIVSEPIALM
jgi:hypothetical protein